MTALRRVATAAAVALLLTSCGSKTTPAAQVPALGSALDEVDAALVAEDVDAALTALDHLTSLTTSARADGRLDEGDAEEVLTATDALRARLDDLAEDEDTVDEPDEPDEPDDAEPSPPKPKPKADKSKNTKKDKTRGRGHGPSDTSRSDHSRG